MQESILVHELPDTGGNRAHSMLIALGSLLLLAWTIVTITELSYYLHDPHIPWWQPATLMMCSVLVVIAWLTAWVRSGQYDRISLDQPAQWFASRLRGLPFIVMGAIALIYGLRYLVFTLAGESYRHLGWPTLLVFETAKIGTFYGLWLGLAFGVRSFHERQEQGQRLAGLQKTVTEAVLTRVPLSKGVDRLLVPDGERLHTIEAAAIQWIDTADNYLMIHTSGRDYLIRRTLQDLLTQLGEQHFARIHKSTAVNLNEVASLHPLFKGDYEIVLHGGKRLRLSRRYREALFARMGR